MTRIRARVMPCAKFTPTFAFARITYKHGVQWKKEKGRTEGGGEDEHDLRDRTISARGNV